MNTQRVTKELQDPIEEAKRYVANAKEILREKAVKEDDYYNDSKYVCMAGETAWKGCLIALDSALNIKKKKDSRKSIDDYKAMAAKRNQTLLKNVVSGYNLLHLSMGYDGEKSYTIAKTGLQTAETIIDWCSKNKN